MGINHNAKSILKKAALTMGFLTLSLGIVAVTYNPKLTKGFDDPSHIGYKSYYDGKKVAITSSTDSSLANEITMTEAQSTAPTSGQVITISTADELNMFSTKCNSTPAYLTYDYKLITNIDYNDATSSSFIPVGWNNATFSGTFDGQGYEISNLTFKSISTDQDANTYSNMMYFAMFSQNSGTISNLGLKEPSIAITRSISANMSSTGGVSYLVGNNSGTISNSFVIDEGSVLEEKSGIAASGGYRISSFVVDNSGTLSNNYVVVSSVLNYRVTDYLDYAEIAIKNNSGTISNCYFYNGSITSYSSSKITYNEDYGFDDRTISNYLGTYESSTNDLVSALESSWYTKSDYGYYGSFVGIDYAIRRGVTFTETDSNNNKVVSVDINNLNDFKYMYELFKQDDIMASNNITYKIHDDINLANTPIACYTYNKGIGANIEGVAFTTHDRVTLSDGTYSLYPTIFNAAIMDSSRVVTTTGVDCYGMFNYLTGSVKNLNVVSTTADITSAKTSGNAKAFGVISGYVEAGIIENVNAFAAFTNSTTNKNEYYVGGVAGILGGEGSIINSTAGGSINLSAAQTVTVNLSTSYMAGCAIGGVVGFVEDSLGIVSNCFNKANITSNLGQSTIEYAIGGVIGAGYTRTAEKLENAGAITVGQDANSYSSLYVAGIFGRQLGQVNEDVQFTNNGSVTVKPNGNTTYVSGVINADIIKTATGPFTASKFISGNGDTLFYASSMSNGGEITVSGSATNLEYTNVINVNAANGVRSRLTGLYNLAYNKIYNNNPIKTLNKLNAQAISLNNVNKFAGVVNVIGGTATYSTILSNSYNLRGFAFTNSAAVTADYNLNGFASGSYISYDNVYNEGDINVSITKAITGDINVNGLFDELSSSSTASSIYNAGNIDINFTADITGNINASGICYTNKNGITNINAYNPTSATYDSTLTGSLNNVVNKGNIKVSSTDFSNIKYEKYHWYRNTEVTDNVNGYAVANVLETEYSGVKLIGNINTAGIVNVNESVITNTFNLGNIKALNYITETTSTNIRQINAGGITALNVGKYAYIINSANNGDITAANLSTYTYVTHTGDYNNNGTATEDSNKVNPKQTTEYYSDVNVGGIVSRNDKNADGTSYSSDTTIANSSQVISFTINYGSIYAYNFAEINYTATTSTKCKAAGIIGSGLCNVINVNNYGTVYSGDTGAGIFGLVSLANYSTEVAANEIYIANTINYGNIYSLKHAYDEFHLAINAISSTTSQDNTHPTYTDFENDNLNSYKFISANLNTRFRYFSGSVIGIIDFANSTSAATKIVVRYLVSFNDNVAISGAEINVNTSVVANTTTIYSPYLKPDVDGYKDRDDYLATNVQYAPLASGSYTADFLKTNSTSGGHDIMTFYGVFNSNFTFRKVIEGKYANGSDYFNTTTYATDKFLTDFFQFIPYSFVNDNLMEKIGWKTSAYLDAANKFANSLDGTYKLYNKISSSTYTTDLTAALNTSTWSQYANPEVLKELVTKLIASDDKTAICAYIEYIFADSNDNSAIFTSDLRGTIVEYVYATYPTLLNEAQLFNFADGYSTILANALCSNESNAVKEHVIENITTYISGLSGATKEDLLLAYIDYLKDHGTSFFAATTSTSKYELLQNLFNTVTDELFYTTLLSLFSSENQTIINGFADTLSGYGGYQTLTPAQKVSFFTNVIENNTAANIKTYLDAFATEIGLFDYLKADGYDEPSFSGLATNIASTTTNNTNEDVIDERVKLWNKIKDSTYFTSWFTGLGIGTKYYLATEVNNTYQTDSAPVPYGSTGDTALAMFNDADNPNVLGQTSDINFIYTTNVTPNTYFYGPYASDTPRNSTSYVTIPAVKLKTLVWVGNSGSRTQTNIVSVGTYIYTANTGNTTATAELDGEYYTRSGNYNYTYTKQSTYNRSATYYIPNFNYYIPNGDGTTLSNNTQSTINYNVTNITADQVANGNATTGWYSVLLTEGVSASELNNLKSVATGTAGLVRANDPLTICKRISPGNYDNSYLGYFSVPLIYRTIRTDDYVIYNGVKQPLGYVTLKRQDSSVKEYVLGNTTIDCDNGSYSVYKSNGTLIASDLTNWDYLLNNYVHIATVNSSTINWHPTGRTGVYVQFTQNSNNPRQIRIAYTESRVFTTRYIDYSDTQLLKLDGYLTGYSDGTTVNSDERDIINDIFNTILLTSSNRTAFMQVVAKVLFESLGTTNTTNHINFIDNFVSNGYLTNTKVGTTAPLTYLKYSSTQTIAEYLSDLSTDGDTKKKILNAAASNMNVFVELMEILFDESKTTGAVTTWNPNGNGYGTSTDIKALYESLGGVDGTDIAKGYAYPFKIASTTLVEPASSTINMNLSSGTKAVDACSTYAATSSNIGYYVGSDIKVYKKDNKADFTNFYYPNGDGTPYTLPTADHAAPTSDIISYLSDTKTDGTTSYRNGDYLIRLTGTSQLDINNESGMVVVPNATVGTWTGNLLVPNRCIWVAPTTPGTFKFVLSNIENSEKMGFRLYKLTRSNPGNYNTYFTNLETSIECNKQLQAGKSYYYEINISQDDIDAGYEYAIATGDGYKPYITYIDIGTNGTVDLTPSKTYYVQNEIKPTDAFLNKAITYLTPLEGASSGVSYPVSYTYTLATSYDSNTDYYEAVTENSVTKYKKASGVTSSNYSSYYVRSAVDKTIEDYQNALLADNTFMKLLAKSSKKATSTLIQSLSTETACKEMLLYLLSKDSRVFDSIINYANTNSLLTDDYKIYLTGGWLATDYYRKYKTDLTTTTLYTRVNSLGDAYKYITGEQSIDSAKFEALCAYIGYDLDMNYGIFALASNKGIQNGVFIPDNLTLSTMDAYYSYDTTNGIYVISDDTKSAYWRLDGTTSYANAASSGYTGNNAVTYTESVNYNFYIEMKQLKKSIATTIFELDITNGTDTYYGDVDLENSTVTFYSGASSISGNFTISNLVIADNATSNKNVNASLASVSGYGTSFDTITITAEETTVTKTYSLVFKKLNVSFDMKYSDNSTSMTVAPSSTDTQVVINVTSSGDTKLPAGLNLKPYISLVGDNTYDMNSEYVTLSTQSQDHVVDTNGSATITMDISYELPADEYAITLSICGASDSVTYIKQVNTANAITRFGFDGADRVNSFSGNTLTSTIPFGRAYDDTELTGYTADTFYLYDFEISPNATVAINAAKEIGTNGLMTYTVTYTVTSESGTDAVYTHVMTENTPFANNSTYASIFADGNIVNVISAGSDYSDLTEDQRPLFLSAGTLTYLTAEDTYVSETGVWSLEDDMKAEVSFNRGVEPQYRIKYNLSNFYTLGNSVHYSASAATLANGAATQVTYAGLTVTVSENNDTGIYTFVYVYENTGVWEGENYTRTYTFPEFIINKLASTDALLKELTFLEQSIVLGNTATVMYPETVLVPDKAGANATYDSSDKTYDTAFSETSRDIVVSTAGINYKNDSDSTDYNDYYAIGTVADAYLGYYCPGFKIEEHAQIYQYTTLEKLTEYGADNNQTKTDKAILNDHTSTMYLYVPFIGNDGIEIYLVELDSNNYWTNVYSTEFDGTNASGVGIKKWTYTANTVNALNAKDYVPTETGAMRVSDTCGNATGNTSLYMDYIGTPIDGHFWYVSYVIFSEEKLQGGTSAGNIRFYHISVIDATNTIQFNVNIYVINTLTTEQLADIYLTIAENIYKDTTLSSKRQISAHATPLTENNVVVTANASTQTASGVTLASTYNVYTLKYTLQTLPKGYFYFHVDLPNGYVAKAYTDMPNQLDESTDKVGSTNEPGSFLPKTSIITIKVALDIVIDAGTGAEDTSVWAVKTSDIYTVQATFVEIHKDTTN